MFMSKEVRIRLYRVQDYELYTLYFDRNFPIGYALRQVVLAYANGEPAPVFSVKNVKKCPKGKPFVVTTSFLLHDNETSAIEMINRLSVNGRNANNFVKHLLRRSLVDIEALYFDDADQNDYKDAGTTGIQGPGAKVYRKIPSADVSPDQAKQTTGENVSEPVEEIISLQENDDKEQKQKEKPVRKQSPPKPVHRQKQTDQGTPDAFSMFNDILEEY